MPQLSFSQRQVLHCPAYAGGLYVEHGRWQHIVIGRLFGARHVICHLLAHIQQNGISH